MSQYITKIRTDQGDLQIDYKALANLPTISNPNLLINSDFRNPVNQRGQTTYAPAKNVLVYTIDRWGIFPSTNDGEGHTLTVNNGYITFANTNANMSAYMVQHLETPLSGTYTISVKVKSATKAFNLSYRDNGTAYSAMTLNTGINSATITCTSLDFIRFGISSVASVDIEWIKLEAGDTATSFSPRLYAEEIALCQRYYTKSNGIRLPITHGTTSLFMIVPLCTTMRSIPSVTFSKTNIVIVRDDNAESHSCVIGANVVNMTDTHLILTIDSNYDVSTFKTGCVAEDFPIAFDAEIY